MITLGVILLIVCYFTIRPLTYAGAALIALGLLLWLTHTGSPLGTHWY